MSVLTLPRRLFKQNTAGYRIRSALLCLVAVYLVFLTVALTYMTYRQYQAEMEEITQSAKVIRIFSIAETNKFIEQSRVLLAKLANHPAVRSSEAGRCDTLLGELRDLQPTSANLVILDQTGKIVCSSMELRKIANEAGDHQQYFTQVGLTKEFTLGQPQQVGTSGKWISTFAHPILDENGELKGVVGLIIDLQRFQPFASALNTPKGTVSSIVNHAGTIVAISENQTGKIGKTITKEALAKALAIKEGAFRMTDNEGGERFVSLGPIKNSDWSLFVSIDVETLLDPTIHFAWRRILFLFLMLLVLTYVTLRVTRLITRPVEAVSETLARVTAGDIQARVKPAGPREIHQIASRLNEMLDARERAIQTLQQSEERFRIAFRTSPDALSITRLDDHRFIEVNDGFILKSGWSRQEIVGRTAEELNLWKWPHERQKLVRAIKERGECAEMEAEFISKDGRVWAGVVLAQLIVLEGAPCILTTTRDLTERNMSLELIHNLSFFDTLTGLPNRRMFIERLQRSITASQINKNLGALVLIDIDGFKTINDTLGHDEGDLLLKEMTKRLQECTRPGDTLARIGGDEFAILMNDVGVQKDSAQLKVLAECQKIQIILRKPYLLSGSEHHRTASIGITFIGVDHENAREPLRRADLAMDHAKIAGRNTLKIFEPSMQVSLNARVSMEESLVMAIESNQLELHYQPQISDVNSVIGAEALVRWNDPKSGAIPPSVFIPLAEETGLIIPLGQWVLEAACAQIARWENDPEMSHLVIAVNVSVRQFHQDDFVEQVKLTLARTGARADRLKLELTESILISNAADLQDKMNTLKALGVSFALDDFGTGYSALAYLKLLPLDQLKIDRSFVRDILIDPNDYAIAKMVVALAESMGLSVIAEGVETEEQRHVLAGIGCHSYQGYLFSGPIPQDVFKKMMGQLGKISV